MRVLRRQPLLHDSIERWGWIPFAIAVVVAIVCIANASRAEPDRGLGPRSEERMTP